MLPEGKCIMLQESPEASRTYLFSEWLIIGIQCNSCNPRSREHLKWAVNSYQAEWCTGWWDQWLLSVWGSGGRLAGPQWRVCWSLAIHWARAELYCAGQTAQHETTVVANILHGEGINKRKMIELSEFRLRISTAFRFHVCMLFSTLLWMSVNIKTEQQKMVCSLTDYRRCFSLSF